MPQWALENGILILWCLKKAEFCAVPPIPSNGRWFCYFSVFCVYAIVAISFPLLLLLPFISSFLLFIKFSFFSLLVNLNNSFFYFFILTSLLNTRDRNSAQTFVFSAWNSPVNSTWWFFYCRKCCDCGMNKRKIKTLNLISQLAFVIWNNLLQSN